MQMIGYSERGALGALLNEIAYSADPERLLSSILDLAHFPLCPYRLASVVSATILLEQSLSDFGDADAILLLETSNSSAVVFVEAKVKPSQAGDWSVEGEFKGFFGGTASKVSSSNLFTQLYHKRRLVLALETGGVESLRRGIRFPVSSTRAMRKIGDNPVVLKAVSCINEHLKDVRYLAIVPDVPSRAKAFFEEVLPTYKPLGYDGWDTRDYGYICWSDIDAFCRRSNLVNTLRVLDFNQGQIY